MVTDVVCIREGMTLTTLLFFCFVGRVLVFVLQKFPFRHVWIIGGWWGEGKFLRQLFDCDLCLGVWVYTVLSAVMGMNILYEYVYIPLVSELITGMTISFIVWIFRNGWETLFRVYHVD